MAVALALLTVASSAAPEEAPRPLDARLDEIFADFDSTNSPGCALGVIRDGTLVVRRGYGMASLEQGVPNSSTTVFYVGSTSKQFVAASILLAAEQGYLSLDDDIRKHLPELPEWQAPITIRHLLHHTSGLRDYLSLMDLADMRFEDVHSDAEIVELIGRQRELNFRPGEEYLYSNTGYFLLAQIVGRATGQSLREFAQENIFAPLAMTRTHFHDDRKQVVPGRATAYEAAEDGGFELDFYLNFDKVGSGGLLTTIEDLARWDRDFYNNQLGKGGLTKDMLVCGVLNDGEELDYARAIVHGEYRGLRTLSHAGAFMGFRAQLLRFPDERLSVACLCNVGHANPSALAYSVAELFLEEKMEPEPSAPTSGQGPGAGEIRMSPAELDRHAGSYRDPDGSLVVKSFVEEGQLWSLWGREDKRELRPLGPARFTVVGTPGEVEFEAATPDRPARMRVDWGSGETTVLEAFDPWTPEPAELLRYTGSYYSEELDVVHRIEVHEGVPVLLIGRNPEEHTLEPVVPGELAGDFLTVRFSPPDEVGSMVLYAGRVRNLRFRRVDTD